MLTATHVAPLWYNNSDTSACRRFVASKPIAVLNYMQILFKTSSLKWQHSGETASSWNKLIASCRELTDWNCSVVFIGTTMFTCMGVPGHNNIMVSVLDHSVCLLDKSYIYIVSFIQCR